MQAGLQEQHVDENGSDKSCSNRQTHRITGGQTQSSTQEWKPRLAIVAASSSAAAVITSAVRHGIAISNSSQQTHGFVHARDFGRRPLNFRGSCQRALKRTLSLAGRPEALFTIHCRPLGGRADQNGEQSVMRHGAQ
jgi:hypothetical protein